MITLSFPKPTDAKSMNEVIKSSWYATYINPEIGVTKEDIDMIYAQSEKQQIETFRKRAESPKENDITLIAKESDKVVGIIRLLILDDHIRVRTMYVHPEFTGKGIGTMLWNEAQKHFSSNKNVVAFPVEYTKSINWYKKIGFVKTGEKKVDDEAMPVSGIHLKTIKMQLTRK
jgi:ribosomal protein S18 acetylase RimI-like enzyme